MSEDKDPNTPVRDYGSFSHKGGQYDDPDSHHKDSQYNAYVGIHFPSQSETTDKRKKHRHHHRRHRNKDSPQDDDAYEPAKPTTPPSQRVQFILGQDVDDDDDAHRPHDIFCEMDELRCIGDDGDMEWKETARWVKFEEDVEEGGERWSKPRVATLSLHSLFELRKGILIGTVMLDLEATNIFQVADLVLDNMVASNHLAEENKERVRDALLARHRHQHEHEKSKGLPIIRSLADIGKRHSEKKLEGKDKGEGGMTSSKTAPQFKTSSSSGNLSSILPKRGSSKDLGHHNHNESAAELADTPSSHKLNQHFMKKIPAGAEASNILVGEVDFLLNPVIAFVRLKKAVLLGDLTEVPVPTRFLFLLLGPKGNQGRYHEIGRSIATLMSDEIFHDVAYAAKSRQDLLAGIDEFLDQVTVLPPGEWDPNIRIEPPKSVPSQESRKVGGAGGGVPNGSALVDGVDGEEEQHGDDTLVRSGRLFGGLIADIKRKAPFYLSDFKDALHVQCIASFIFMYFACLTPIITFGGLLGAATDNYIAALESILSGAICGITYHMFSGQPLTIIGSTGPVLVFETIMFNFSKDMGFDFLALRFWVGLWCCVILLFMVAFDLSALVRFITRFTEESFAALISLIFIYEAFKKLIHILDHDPINMQPGVHVPLVTDNCSCIEPPDNVTKSQTLWNYHKPYACPIPMDSNNNTLFGNLTLECCQSGDGILVGSTCDAIKYAPDVFFLSCLLFLGTFAIAIYLKGFKTARFFPSKVRALISDFAVLIAIVSMVVVDLLVGLPTPKLNVPEDFKPTNPKRDWIINPMANAWWTIPAAILPALLATILIFMDQQITAVIVNRKENKLKKGGGYHLDLFIIAILIGFCSVMGLPWFVAATVLSINHVRSLTKESESSAPGERPKFLGVREQRVTGIMVFLMVGLSVLMTGVLKFIPMPVLYGVFLFMGVSSLVGVQLVQRIFIVFMPPKYQPDYIFLRHVRTKRVHLFTSIQVLCLAILWVIKTIKSVSIVFPLMVLAMCFVRKALDWLFTRHELKWLDDIMPEAHKREKEEKQKQHDAELAQQDEDTSTFQSQQIIEMKSGGTVQVPLSDGKTIAIPVDKITFNPNKNQINISDEMSKTAIWKQLVANTMSPDEKRSDNRSNLRKKKKVPTATLR